MAVIDALPGITVSIEVDGELLTEYDNGDEENSTNEVTRYIESPSDVNFRIRISANAGTKCFLANALAFYICVDGSQADSIIVNKQDCRHSQDTVYCEGFRASSNQVRPFKFSSLKIVSDGTVKEAEPASMQHFGTIKVTVEQRINSNKPLWGVGKFASMPSALEKVSEKALKGQALSHSVGSSDPVHRPGHLVQTKLVNPAKPTAATFVFRYRSLEALKSMLIIPRTPTPPPLEYKDYDSLTREDVAELQRRARMAGDREETKPTIKRERTDDGPRPRKVARPSAGSTQLEVDDDGTFRESSTASLPPREAPEVIELD